MKNNRGLSLIEVIIVIAIMAIVGVSGFAFMTLQSNSKVNECANKISASISKVRVDAMSKSKTPGDCYVEVGKEANGKYYIKKCTPAGESKDIVGNSNITIKFYSPDSDEYTVSASTVLTLKFDRTTGGFVPTTPETDSEHVAKILVNNGKREIELNLSSITGKVQMVVK